MTGIILGHVWTLPNTVVGLLAALLGGAKLARFERGALIFVAGERGAWRWWFDHGWAGITIGGVIVFSNHAQSVSPWLTRHELRHWFQYRLLGPLFLPVYGVASLVALAQGRRVYHDNVFELDAERAERE